MAAHFRPRFTGKRQEIVVAVLLNGQNQPLAEKTITEGTPTQATVYVRRIQSGDRRDGGQRNRMSTVAGHAPTSRIVPPKRWNANLKPDCQEPRYVG